MRKLGKTTLVVDLTEGYFKGVSDTFWSCLYIYIKDCYLLFLLLLGGEKKAQSASLSFYKYQGYVFATVDMKGRLFQCFDAVWVHGRGAFKVASEVALKPQGARALVTCPMVVLLAASEDLVCSPPSFLRHETKPNRLSWVWHRAWQLVRFLNFLSTLPIPF